MSGFWNYGSTQINVLFEEKEFIKKGFVVGQKHFRQHGFVQCLNPNYMENDFYTVHYNRILKGWIVDKK